MFKVQAVLVSGVVIVALSCAALLSSQAVSGEPADDKIRVILLSGQNNHNWQATTPRLVAILRAAGFSVDVTEAPQDLTADDLVAYDVIVSNWNSWGSGPNGVHQWPEELREAYIAFVREGGGHVVVHAGSSSFFNWDDYQNLSLATWRRGQTGHNPVREFDVRIDDADHPITRGLKPFTTVDELWHRSGIQEHAHVLASGFSEKDPRGSGAWEPIAMVGEFGEGRSFTLLLGHHEPAMHNEGFGILLARGTEWAATGEVEMTRAMGKETN